MKVFVKKNKGESNERLISRFNKKVQGSRKILKVRSERYHKKDLTRTQQRGAAIMREHYRAIREKNRFY